MKLIQWFLSFGPNLRNISKSFHNAHRPNQIWTMLDYANFAELDWHYPSSILELFSLLSTSKSYTDIPLIKFWIAATKPNLLDIIRNAYTYLAKSKFPQNIIKYWVFRAYFRFNASQCLLIRRNLAFMEYAVSRNRHKNSKFGDKPHYIRNVERVAPTDQKNEGDTL